MLNNILGEQFNRMVNIELNSFNECSRGSDNGIVLYNKIAIIKMRVDFLNVGFVFWNDDYAIIFHDKNTINIPKSNVSSFFHTVSCPQSIALVFIFKNKNRMESLPYGCFGWANAHRYHIIQQNGLFFNATTRYSHYFI